MGSPDCLFVSEISESSIRTAEELRIAFVRIRRRMREAADADDLTPTQASVLTRLGKEEARTAAALAGLERVRPQSMAAVVSALEERGLVERSPDPDDARRRILRLTAAGSERFTRATAERAAWLARTMEERLTEEERATVHAAIALLERIARP
jgi:DNA-binding MarR family transcriptional regulator